MLSTEESQKRLNFWCSRRYDAWLVQGQQGSTYRKGQGVPKGTQAEGILPVPELWTVAAERKSRGGTWTRVGPSGRKGGRNLRVGRPKEYKNRIHFGSSMDADTYNTLRKICDGSGVQINEIWQEAAESFLFKYGDGNVGRKEPELPSIFATRDEFLAWAYKVGPDGLRKALDNLPFLEKHGRAQARVIEMFWKEKMKAAASEAKV